MLGNGLRQIESGLASRDAGAIPHKQVDVQIERQPGHPRRFVQISDILCVVDAKDRIGTLLRQMDRSLDLIGSDYRSGDQQTFHAAASEGLRLTELGGACSHSSGRHQSQSDFGTLVCLSMRAQGAILRFDV